MDNRIRVLRAERKWSQRDLSTRSGISREHLSAIERGKHTPGIFTLQKIAGAFNVPLKEVFPALFVIHDHHIGIH